MLLYQFHRNPSVRMREKDWLCDRGRARVTVGGLRPTLAFAQLILRTHLSQLPKSGIINPN